MRTGLLLLVATMLLLAPACGDDETGDEHLSALAWCEVQWNDGMSPADWNHDRFIKDCIDGLAAGFTREQTRAIYEEAKADGA